MAARLAPDNVRRVHQSLHHVVADAPWNDEDVLAEVRSYVLTAMRQQGPVQAWIVDDTGFVKKGTHSVGVTRQYCGQVGKQENCRVAVSLSVGTQTASLPIAWRLYLPEVWAEDQARRKQAGVPDQARLGLRTDPRSRETGGAASARAGRCWLRHRHALPRRAYETGTALRGGHYVFGEHLEAGRSAAAEAGTESHRASDEAVAPGPGSPAGCGEGVGIVFTRVSLENDHLAARYETESSFAICRGAGTASPSRLLAQRTAPRRMAADRVAHW